MIREALGRFFRHCIARSAAAEAATVYVPPSSLPSMDMLGAAPIVRKSHRGLSQTCRNFMTQAEIDIFEAGGEPDWSLIAKRKLGGIRVPKAANGDAPIPVAFVSSDASSMTFRWPA